MKVTFLFLFFLFSLYKGFATRMKILKKSNLPRELSTTSLRSSTETADLTLDNINQNILRLIKEKNLKLISSNSDSKNLEINLLNKNKRGLSIKVQPDNNEYKIRLKSIDGEEDDMMTVPNKIYYNAEIENFLNSKLHGPKKERRETYKWLR